MKRGKTKPLPDSAFVVLALIAEGETHGYAIQRIVQTRGFQFWTSLKRSSAYNALVLLEDEGFVKSEILPGEGPDKKVYHLTTSGNQKLIEDGDKHLSSPAHAKSEIDLGIYVLPLLPRKIAKEALARCLLYLHSRKEFLEERLNWCRRKKLELPALAFERPLLLLEAEINWVLKVKAEFESNTRLRSEDWKKYEYREPPGTERS